MQKIEKILQLSKGANSCSGFYYAVLLDKQQTSITEVVDDGECCEQCAPTLELKLKQEYIGQFAHGGLVAGVEIRRESSPEYDDMRYCFVCHGALTDVSYPCHMEEFDYFLEMENEEMVRILAENKQFARTLHFLATDAFIAGDKQNQLLQKIQSLIF